jgi:hypothetical protein
VDESSWKEVHLKVGPYTDDSLTVAFEPTGMTYELAAGQSFSVVLKGTGTGLVEIGHTPDAISVGAWAGAETFVFTEDGTRLEI